MTDQTLPSDEHHALVQEAKTYYGLVLPRDCPTKPMVGGAILDAQIDWRDWYNDGKNNITVLGAISYIISKHPSLIPSEAALLAYVEFHRWKKEQEKPNLFDAAAAENDFGAQLLESQHQLARLNRWMREEGVTDKNLKTAPAIVDEVIRLLGRKE